MVQAGSTWAPDRPPFAYEEIDLPHPDGARQIAWLMPHTASGANSWILYLHGNATTITSHVNISHYRLLRDLGLNIIAPEYRGFGGLEGVATELSLQADARAAYEYLRTTRQISPSRIIAYGWSLGSALAVDLASREPFAIVILEAAPASLIDLTQQRYPFFPLRLLMRNRFDAIRNIDRISSPLLFLHSTHDEVIPISEGRRLFDAAGGEKTFVEIGGGHFTASEVDGQRVAEAIRSVLTRHGIDLETEK